MMRAEEIGRERWARFAESFGDRHQGWLVRAVARSAEGAEEQVFRGASLERVELDPARVVVRARMPQSGVSVTLAADRPRRVVEISSDDGGHAGLLVETGGGAIELRFRVSARPETVDGA